MQVVGVLIVQECIEAAKESKKRKQNISLRKLWATGGACLMERTMAKCSETWYVRFLYFLYFIESCTLIRGYLRCLYFLYIWIHMITNLANLFVLSILDLFSNVGGGIKLLPHSTLPYWLMYKI